MTDDESMDDELLEGGNIEEFLSEITEEEFEDWAALGRNLRELREAARREHAASVMTGIRDLPEFGLFHLSVCEAAVLISLDRWRSGDLPTVSFSESTATIPEMPSLLHALKPETVKVIEALCHDIKAGSLKAAIVRKGWDGALLPELTMLDMRLVQRWLEERCCLVGDTFNQYWHSELDRHNQLLRHAMFLRMRKLSEPVLPGRGLVQENDEGVPEDLEEMTKEELIEHYKALQIKNGNLARLASAAYSPAEKPLAERERTTLLVMTAALLEYIAGNLPNVEKHPSFQSEAKLIEVLAESFAGYSGLSQSNLQRKFPEAKRALKAQ